MTKKQITFVVVAVALIGLCLYIRRDWFARDKIQIYHRLVQTRSISRRARPANAPDLTPIFFGFDRKLKLTSIKVFPVSEIEAGKYPHPVWEMISDSNAVPTMGFVYGMNVPGMKPAVEGATADPLEPGVAYRLIIEAGPLKAEHNFTVAPKKN
jgi:hypothetical protein